KFFVDFAYNLMGDLEPRNEIIFGNRVIDSKVAAAEENKGLSWRWDLNCMNMPICMYYEWSWDPGNCLRSAVRVFVGLGVSITRRVWCV
ncbi:hypothetical protein A2U01_0037103, partial [Trifolium medium]|nr:hypothetical protein [Trifolium medium]